jgi:hypothetical protein
MATFETPSKAAAGVNSATRAALWLAGATILALILYYFIGIDQGATSVFGSDMHVHEFVHDARHFLGFPCH